MKSGVLWLCAAFWAVLLAFPWHHLQHLRTRLLGFTVPIYYLVLIPPVLLAAVAGAFANRTWTKWKLAWLALPLVCVPGILLSTDPLWSARQWLSLGLRGIVPAAVIFLLADRWKAQQIARALCWGAVAAAALGWIEFFWGWNPISKAFVFEDLLPVLEPANPFYRVFAGGHSATAHVMGTQGNNIPYAACLIPFFFVALWRWEGLSMKKWPGALPPAAILGAILFSAARSGWVGLAVGSLFYLAAGTKTRRIAASAGLALTLSVSAVLSSGHLRRGERQSILSLSQDRNIAHRLGSLSNIRALHGRAWLFGIGYGGYPEIHDSYYRGPYPNLKTPDNQYFRWLLETGLVGVAALACFLILYLSEAVGAARRMASPADAGFVVCLIAGWLGIAGTFLFFDGFYWAAANMTYWGVLGLIGSSLREPA